MKTICTEGVSDGKRIERGGGGAMEITQSPPPPTVHSNSNSNVAALRNDREPFNVTSPSINETPALLVTSIWYIKHISE